MRTEMFISIFLEFLMVGVAFFHHGGAQCFTECFFYHDNFIGCFSADIKNARKYFFIFRFIKTGQKNFLVAILTMKNGLKKFMFCSLHQQKNGLSEIFFHLFDDE